ncbi:kelch-like protein 24 [Megalops cyprinoides]|uniref:kelch-like protein 24 n=1 Tax=Megalops cyprinoides TaxID=118141 RepID=UPI001863FC4B|nr:kelch-like protein 24 [Megalops cyprinoides]
MACRQPEREVCNLNTTTSPELQAGDLDTTHTHTCAAVEELQREMVPDAVLQVETESFLVNRQRLANLSPYFRALFYGGGLESAKSHIEIKGVRLEQFRILMEYAQNSRLSLDRENVLGILETADFLQLEQARLLCCKFLERELHLSNCLGMMAYAWQLGCLELYTAAREVALTHLPALACEEDFLYLSKESVADLLSSDGLFLPREDFAFEVVLRWATYDPSREDDFVELAGLVRPECLTLSYISELLTSVKGSDSRAKLICKLDTHPPASWSEARSKPRTRATDTLYVLGGPHDLDKQTLYQFHPRCGVWQSCAPLKRKNLTQYAVAAVGENVVVTGGYFLDEFVWYSVDWVRVFQCEYNRWVDGPSMQKSRHSHCSVGLGDRLFVLGGSMDEGPVADVERLTMGAEGWESTSPLVRAVERAAVATLGACIYIACGLDENGEVYSGIQRYQVEADQWDVVSYSPLPRYDLLATELNGALYVFGGQALRLDVITDEWTVVEEDCLDRKFFTGCSTANGQVYLMGERKGNKSLPNMVLLDPYTDTCIEIENNIPCPVPIHGCVTIRITS